MQILCWEGRPRKYGHAGVSHLVPWPEDYDIFYLVVYVTPLQTAIPNSTCLKPCWINLLWIPQNKKLRSLLAYHCESIKHSVILLFVPAVTTPHPSSHFCWLCQHICRRKRHNNKAATATTSWTAWPSPAGWQKQLIIWYEVSQRTVGKCRKENAQFCCVTNTKLNKRIGFWASFTSIYVWLSNTKDSCSLSSKS